MAGLAPLDPPMHETECHRRTDTTKLHMFGNRREW